MTKRIEKRIQQIQGQIEDKMHNAQEREHDLNMDGRILDKICDWWYMEAEALEALKRHWEAELARRQR